MMVFDFLKRFGKAFFSPKMLIGMGATAGIALASSYLNMPTAELKGAICGAPVVPIATPAPELPPPPPPEDAR